jgi:acetyl-CoA carboxylase biotin carboxyl carrier protein
MASPLAYNWPAGTGAHQNKAPAKNGLRTYMTKKTHDADVAFIQALAELLRENDLTELQVKRDYGADDSLNVRVSRHLQQTAAQTVAVAPPGRARSRLCGSTRSRCARADVRRR